MYKYSDGQIRFSDFNQPMGLTMSPENRWVKKADLIPWDELECEYAGLFKSKTGTVAKPFRLALGALLIQIEYGYSDEEVALQIRENPYLQYFCGMGGYEDKAPFDPSLMVHFRKRLTPEKISAINERIIQKAVTKKQTNDKNKDNNDKDEPPSNKGTMIVDATCVSSNIKYPQDTALLNESREKLEKIIKTMHNPDDGKKPRTYPKKARRDYLKIARKKKKTKQEIRISVRKQLQYVKRDISHIQTMLKNGKTMSTKHEEQFEIIKEIYNQQQHMYKERTHKVADRIVNIRQPYIRPIVRGKAKAMVEFGAKIEISVTEGYVRLEKQSFDAYNESESLREAIERYYERYGYYPKRVLADKIYRNRTNIAYCKQKGIRLSGPALGRPKKDEATDKKQEYKDICERVEVERAFSHAKRKFGMGLIKTYLKETTQAVIALSILALNLHKIHCAFLLSFFAAWLKNFAFELCEENLLAVR